MTTFVGLCSYFQCLAHTYMYIHTYMVYVHTGGKEKKKKAHHFPVFVTVFVKSVLVGSVWTLESSKVRLKMRQTGVSSGSSASERKPLKRQRNQSVWEAWGRNNPKRGKPLREVCLVTVAWQVGEPLTLAPLPLAVADVEANGHGAGYPLVAVRRDLYHQRGLL